MVCRYHGEKLSAFGGPPTIKRPRSDDANSAFRITTVYDSPEITDPDEQLLRRNESTHLKHRSRNTTFVRSADRLGGGSSRTN